MPPTSILRLLTLDFLLCTSENSPTTTKMSTHNTFILLQPQWLHPSLSKLWHQGVGFTLYWRSADADGNATAHMHLFITWSCIYISQEMSVSLFERWFPRGGSHGNKQRRQQWGCSGQYGSLGALLCLQLEGKWHPGRHSLGLIDLVVRAARGRLRLLTTTEKAVKTALCAGVSEPHTHTHLCELWEAAWRCEGGSSEAESSSEKTHRAETHGGRSVRRREGNKRSLSTQEAADLLSAAF